MRHSEQSSSASARDSRDSSYDNRKSSNTVFDKHSDSPRSTFFIPRPTSKNLNQNLSTRRKKSHEDAAAPAVAQEGSFVNRGQAGIQCHTLQLDLLSCTGQSLFATSIFGTIEEQAHFYMVTKHFGHRFSSQMLLSVLASLHDVLHSIASKFNSGTGGSFHASRDDIDVQRLEECVNDLFVTCLSRPYCRGGSASQSAFTFEANSKVWRLCLPLAAACFRQWSSSFPLETKRWQEFAYHFSNLKSCGYSADIVDSLNDTLIRSYAPRDMLPVPVEAGEDDMDEASAGVNICVKSSEGSKQMLCATPAKIVEALVFRQEEFGATFKEVFFCGFRNYMTPMQLLLHLMGCVEQTIRDSTHLPVELSKSSTTAPHVMNLLKYWITTYGSDWDEQLLAAVHLLLQRCSALLMEKHAVVDDAFDLLSPLRANAATTGAEDLVRSGKAAAAAAAADAAGTPNSSPAPQIEAESPASRTYVRTSISFYSSSFQVFVRAMLRHLRCSSRFEPPSSEGPFDSLAAKLVASSPAAQRGTLVAGSPAAQRATNVPTMLLQHSDADDMFLMMPPRHWAQCLTLHSFHVFRRFQPEEFFRAPFPAWQAKPEALRRLLVPNIAANTQFFNLIKDFFVGCIFRNDGAYRKRALVHVIDIAYAMKQLNNFDGLFSAMSALDSFGVFRLKKLWQSVSSPEYEDKLSQLRKLTESRNKFANYTEALRTAFPPKLPYVGHFLGSLFMQSERHPKASKSKAQGSAECMFPCFHLTRAPQTVLKNEVSLVNFGRYYGLHEVVFNDICHTSHVTRHTSQGGVQRHPAAPRHSLHLRWRR